MFEHLGLTYRDSDYTTVIAISPDLNVKVGAEIHLGGGDMSAFVLPLAAIARALSSTSGGSTALTKTPQDSDHTGVIAVVH